MFIGYIEFYYVNMWQFILRVFLQKGVWNVHTGKSPKAGGADSDLRHNTGTEPPHSPTAHML